jgi:hypothetical protein
MKPLEKDLQRQIAKYLRFRHIVFCQPRNDKKSSMTIGWPDFTFAVKGLAIAFECKTDKGKLSDKQTSCHLAMAANGWRVHVVREFQMAVDLVESYINEKKP